MQRQIKAKKKGQQKNKVKGKFFRTYTHTYTPNKKLCHRQYNVKSVFYTKVLPFHSSSEYVRQYIYLEDKNVSLELLPPL